ncbi:MAG: H-NS histone family protein [Candidatus Competibacteraceae bacterium]|nr:H-NS histone family protein [Candidatus Competibacteraceae bacterium]
MSKAIEEINLEDYNVDQLNELVKKAQKEMENKEKQRLSQVRSEMERLASTLGMSAADVVLGADKKKKSRIAAASSAKVVKYRNPADPTQTWSGKGKRPNWLNEALTKCHKLEEFSVENQ